MSLHRRLDEQTVLVTAVIVVCSFCLWFRFTSTPIRLQRNWAGNHYPHGEGVKGHSCQPWNLTSIGVQFLGMLCTEFFLENCFRKLLLNILCRKVLPRILLLLNLLHSTTTSLYTDCGNNLFCTPHFFYINSNKPTAGRTKAIHRRLELSCNLYLLLLFVGQNRASKSHLHITLRISRFLQFFNK